MSIEKLIGSDFGDTFRDNVSDSLLSKTNQVFDGGEGLDVLTYESREEGVNLYIREIEAIESPAFSFIYETDKILNVERINGTAFDDNFDIKLISGTSLQELDTGAGDDVVTVHGPGAAFVPRIYLGDGDDVLRHASPGSIIQGDAGADVFWLGKDYLIADADEEDRMSWYGLTTLTGGVRWGTSDSPWAYGKFIAANDNQNSRYERVA